jgi:hypothetical protein
MSLSKASHKRNLSESDDLHVLKLSAEYLGTLSDETPAKYSPLDRYRRLKCPTAKKLVISDIYDELPDFYSPNEVSNYIISYLTLNIT